MEEERRLVPAHKIAKRLVILATLIAIGFLGLDVQKGAASEKEAERFRKTVRKWLKREGLWKELTKREMPYYKTPLRDLGYQYIIDASWRGEALFTLLWCLGWTDQILPYDVQARPRDIPEIIPRPGFSTKHFIENAKLRPRKEIEKARDLAELWHWRSRTTQLIKDGLYDDPEELDEIVRMTAKAAKENGDIPTPIDGDFPAQGKAYRDLSAEEYNLVTSIAMERHFSLNWVCGYSEGGWDKTPTDT